MIELTAKERAALERLMKRRKQTDREGRFCEHFTETIAGRTLLQKMQKAGWITWTGFMGMMFNRPCYVINRRGVREANKTLTDAANAQTPLTGTAKV